MKKLIIILLFPVCLNAQIAKDKYYHAGAGVISSGLIFTPVYLSSNDENLSFRAAWMGTSLIAIGKESFDVYNGGNFSFTDIGFTFASGLASAWITKKIINRKKKKKYINFECKLIDEPLK